MKNALVMKKSELIYLVIITVLAVYLRFYYIQEVPTQQLYDFNTYQEIATNIYNHQGHSYMGDAIAWQGMAYPTALGYLYRALGSNDIYYAQLFNLILSIITLIIVFFIFCKLSVNKFIVYGAYTFVAFLPNYIAYNNVVGTEVFFTFLFAVVIFLQLYRFNPWLRIPLLGFFIGVAALSKPFFLAYPFVVAVYEWLKLKDIKKSIVVLLALLFIVSAVISPWTYRNYRLYGEFIPISYNSGYVLYINNNDENISGNWMSLRDVPASPEMKKEIEEILDRHYGQAQLAPELDSILKSDAKEWIIQNPIEFMKLGFLRIKQIYFMGAWDIRSWTANELPLIEDKAEPVEYRRSLSFLYSLSDVLIYTISSVGLLYMLLNIFPIIHAVFRKEIKIADYIALPTLNLAFFLGIFFVFEGQARYNYPVLFLLAFCTFVTMEQVRKMNKNESNHL